MFMKGEALQLSICLSFLSRASSKKPGVSFAKSCNSPCAQWSVIHDRFTIALSQLLASQTKDKRNAKSEVNEKKLEQSCITAGNIQTSTSDILKQAPWRLWSHLKTLMIGSCPRDSELSCLKPHQLTSSHLDITVYNQSYEEYEDRYIQVISWPTRKIRPWEFGVPKMDLLLERWKRKQFREHLLAPRSDLNCPVRRETLSKRLRPKNPRVLYGVDILSSCHLVKCCPLHFPSNEKIWKKKRHNNFIQYPLFCQHESICEDKKTEDSHFILGAKGRFSGWSYLSRCLFMWQVKQNCQQKHQRIWPGKCETKLSWKGWSFMKLIQVKNFSKCHAPNHA